MKNTLMTMVYVALSFIIIFILMNIYLLPSSDMAGSHSTARNAQKIEVNLASANNN